jgi:dihydropteroate synthase
MEGDVVPQVRAFLEQAALRLQTVGGVARERIVLDPGIGFGKTVAQNFSLLARQAELLADGYALLVGWSRKSSLGAATAVQGVARPSLAMLVASSVAAARSGGGAGGLDRACARCAADGAGAAGLGTPCVRRQHFVTVTNQ